MQRHCIVALLISCGALGCAPAVPLVSEDTALRQAAQAARATLDDFLTKARRQPAGTSAYALRFGVRQGGDTEYFWVDEFTWSDGSFTGRITEPPRRVSGVQPGQIVKFSRADVTDWKYLDERTGKTIGHFTACALLSLESPERAEAIKRRDGLDCSWRPVGV
jgi:uncharacterized protein YegJ (DUF2314 family)